MMKSFLALLTGAFLAVPAMGADVGVSVTVGQPGFYGRIDLGRLPPPPVILPQPVMIHHPPVAVAPRPIYLRVPPGHERDWGKHCRKYDACGQPVYFVRDDWYRNEYSRHHQDDRDHRGDRDDRDGRDAHPGRGHGKGHGRGRRDD